MSANVWQQSHCMNGEGRTCRPAVQLPRALSQVGFKNSLFSLQEGTCNVGSLTHAAGVQTSRQGRCGRRQRAEAIRAQR